METRRFARLWTAAASVGLVGFVRPVPCLAADDSATARAQTLFDQARELSSLGRYEEACPLFAESQRLDPGGGTLLNLALCHERQGKFATAQAELQDALAQAEQAQRADRLRTATEHLKRLAPLVPQLQLRFASSPPPGTHVVLDGKSMAWEANMSVSVDPGAHTVEVGAPGFEPYGTTSVAEPGKITAVAVPELVPSSASTPARPEPAVPAVPPPPPAVVAQQPSRPAVAPAPDPARRTAGFVLSGLGVALLGGGGYFGVRAVMLKERSDDAGCTDTMCPTVASKRDYDSARTAAHLSSAGVGLGLVAVGVGAYLILKGTDHAHAAATVRSLPSLTVDSRMRSGSVSFAVRF